MNSSTRSGGWRLVSRSRGEGTGDDISGAGATFHYHIYSKWADALPADDRRRNLNYQSIGSGGWHQQIQGERPSPSAPPTCP